MPALSTIVTSASLGVSLLNAIAAYLTIKSVPSLHPASSRERDWPRISVVITARDEAASIHAALEKKLADDYPNVEFLVVDDRSTDATGNIIDRIAETDPRVVPLHITKLPPGWLGKVYAMERARELATGEWVLFSDADVHLEKGTLRAAVEHCEKHGLDHLAAFPEVWRSDPLLDASLTAFLRLIVLSGRLWKLSDPESSATVGGGTFNFVKKTMLDELGGFGDVRLDVLDDVLLGQRVKRAGGKQGAAHAVDFIGLHFYTSVREMARGLEKNAFALHRYSMVRCLVATALLLAMELGPLMAMTSGNNHTAILGALSAVVALGTSFAVSVWLRRPLLAVFLGPIGGVIFALMNLRASALAFWRGEIVWRETRYSLDELKRGSRFELPF